MKFWNKDKDIRRRCWTKINRSQGANTDTEVRRWCQLQSSNGKFYHYYGNNSWWFERPEDATWFALNWA